MHHDWIGNTKTLKVLLLTRYGRLGASSRLRMLQFLPFLESKGIVCDVKPLLDDVLLRTKYLEARYRPSQMLGTYVSRLWELIRRNRYNLIWIEKEALPWLPASLERFLLRGIPYVLDFDDALFHHYDLHRSKAVRRLLGHRIDFLMAGARLVIGGNDYLAERARRAGAPWVEVLPTVIDRDRYPLHRPARQDDVPRIVWIGSPSTIGYLAALGASLAVLAKHVAFTLRVIGSTLEMPGVDVECVMWTEQSEAAAISECDIGIMPLKDSSWERGKCGYKLIQYMACALPVVASPVGVNTQIVRDGVNGLLAASPEDWVAKLTQLLSDVPMRERMGRAGREFVESEYCLQQIAPRLANLLLKAGDR